jgi:acyl carrier protein
MSKLELLNQIFIKTLGILRSDLEGLKYNDVPSWDSIGHMTLMSEIEEAFNIFLEVDDIINFSSYLEGIIILKKYNVEL